MQITAQAIYKIGVKIMISKAMINKTILNQPQI